MTLPIIFPVRDTRVEPLADTFSRRFQGRPAHEAHDIVAPLDAAIVAPIDGTIVRVYSGHATIGNGLVVEDADGWRHLFAHMRRRPSFVADDVVNAGDPIGAVGSTGRSDGPHLHYAITNASGRRVNALAQLRTLRLLMLDRRPTMGESSAHALGLSDAERAHLETPSAPTWQGASMAAPTDLGVTSSVPAIPGGGAPTRARPHREPLNERGARYIHRWATTWEPNPGLVEVAPRDADALRARMRETFGAYDRAVAHRVAMGDIATANTIIRRGVEAHREADAQIARRLAAGWSLDRLLMALAEYAQAFGEAARAELAALGEGAAAVIRPIASSALPLVAVGLLGVLLLSKGKNR